MPNTPLTPDLDAARARFWTIRPLERTCRGCGTRYEFMPGNGPTPLYCSDECRDSTNNAIKRERYHRMVAAIRRLAEDDAA